MPAKRTIRKNKVFQESKVSGSKEVVQTAQSSALKDNVKAKMSIALIIIIVIGLLFYFKDLFVAATVNGQPIARISIVRALEKQYGKQVLESEITKALILQEASKEKVSVSSSEIDTEIKNIEKNLESQGQKLDSVLALRGMSRNELIEQIKIQKMLEKMVGKNINVTDAEVNDYMDKNKVSIPEGTNTESFKTNIKNQIKQQKLSDEYQAWIANLQKNAKINKFINY